MRLQSISRLIVTVTLLALSATLLSCLEQRRQNQRQLSFQFALPDGWEVINSDFEGRIVHQANTDGNEGTEWLVLYSFDTPARTALKPVSCAVYHTIRREPRLPIIYPYHLQAPGWTYLGEGGTDRVSVRVEDVVTNIKPDEKFFDPENTYFSPVEVVVESKDASGNITRASIFQWRNTLSEDHWKRIEPREWLVVPGHMPELDRQWYQCLGFFEASLKIQIQKDQVKVWDRVGDRSQLARVSTYTLKAEPSTGAVPSSAYLDVNDRLHPPQSICLAFAFGVPDDVGNSPYPEKIVMAFHARLLSEIDGYPDAFLTQNARNDPDWVILQGRLGAGQIPCVTRIVYDPPAETASTAQSFDDAPSQEAVGQDPSPIRAKVTTLARYGSLDPSEEGTFVVWDLVQIDNAWKIDGIHEIR
jgi:hypothetical protein